MPARLTRRGKRQKRTAVSQTTRTSTKSANVHGLVPQSPSASNLPQLSVLCAQHAPHTGQPLFGCAGVDSEPGPNASSETVPPTKTGREAPCVVATSMASSAESTEDSLRRSLNRKVCQTPRNAEPQHNARQQSSKPWWLPGMTDPVPAGGLSLSPGVSKARLASEWASSDISLVLLWKQVAV